MSGTNKEAIRSTLLGILEPRLLKSGLGSSALDGAKLADLGLVDSTDLLDVILDVEQRCEVVFNPERISFEAALTLDSLASAFDES